MESVVLPNMDDISFFDSWQYEHRGGIWADASRHERAPTLEGEQPNPDQTTPAASVTDAAKTNGDDSQLPIPRSHSADEVGNIGTPSPVPEPMARATTVDATTPAGLGTSPGTKRHTRFSNGQDESDVFTGSPSNPPVTQETVLRGRTLSPDVRTERRSSLPNLVNGAGTQQETSLADETEGDAQYLSATSSSRRSPSQHSRSASSRAASVSSSRGGDISDDSPDGQTANYRPKSPAPPGSSPRQTPTSPSSFFQTLKSRAGDKQALSNTAKEAMRKWGVNWGNFRRETMGSSGSGGATSGDEGVPDAGHGDSRRNDGRTPSTTRPSYAEVRAAVEERRERERTPLQEASSRSNQPASEPIPMPQSEKGKGRAETRPQTTQTQSSVSPVNDSAPTGGSPASTGGARSDSGASAPPRPGSPVPLERTESEVSSSSHHSVTHVLGIAPEESERPPAPVRTQPLPPKTMTIPGIHASHRGEVMSMGYAPPPPVVPQEQKKAPLQSLSRLWKNPGSANSPQGEPAPVSQTGFTGRDQDSTPANAEGEGELASQQLPRPIPPPLPPRAHSTHVHTKPELTRASDTDTSSLSRASAALQSIASKDKQKRASLTPPSSTPSSPEQAEDSSAGNTSESTPRMDLTASPASITPTSSSPPSPPLPSGPNGRGPPPALPPRRQRTSA